MRANEICTSGNSRKRWLDACLDMFYNFEIESRKLILILLDVSFFIYLLIILFVQLFHVLTTSISALSCPFSEGTNTYPSHLPHEYVLILSGNGKYFLICMMQWFLHYDIFPWHTHYNQKKHVTGEVVFLWKECLKIRPFRGKWRLQNQVPW